jgi:hypothetical protein
VPGFLLLPLKFRFTADVTPLKGNVMRVDFSGVPLKNRAFSEKPMTFIDQAPKNFLGAIIDLVAIDRKSVV